MWWLVEHEFEYVLYFILQLYHKQAESPSYLRPRHQTEIVTGAHPGTGARIAYTRAMSEQRCFPKNETKAPSGTDALPFNLANPDGTWSVQLFLPGPW